MKPSFSVLICVMMPWGQWSSPRTTGHRFTTPNEALEWITLNGERQNLYLVMHRGKKVFQSKPWSEEK